MTIKEMVVQELDNLSDAELQQVADYLAFLRFRARTYIRSFDIQRSAALYAEFAAEDRQLAEEGMAEYNLGLRAEDTK